MVLYSRRRPRHCPIPRLQRVYFFWSLHEYIPLTAVVSVHATYNSTDENQQAVMKYMIDNALNFTNQGWGGYIVVRTMHLTRLP
jgi:hypothetical protein